MNHRHNINSFDTTHTRIHTPSTARKSWVWVRHPTQAYTAAYIISKPTHSTAHHPIRTSKIGMLSTPKPAITQQIVTVMTQENIEMTVSVSDIYPMNPSKFLYTPDLSLLSHLNEPSLLYNLKIRYEHDFVYTWSGLFLLSVNPYKDVKDMYGDDMKHVYLPHKNVKDGGVHARASTNFVFGGMHDVLMSKDSPHIYKVASDAYVSMTQNSENQSILITGESGAGKTENTKKVISFLSFIEKMSEGGGSLVGRRVVGDVVSGMILQTNVILEAFGNAQTIRNDNSSRFGKFIKIEFRKGRIVGAHIEKYLLEKSRVTKVNKGERNYHVFYYLLASLLNTNDKEFDNDDVSNEGPNDNNDVGNKGFNIDSKYKNSNIDSNIDSNNINSNINSNINNKNSNINNKNSNIDSNSNNKNSNNSNINSNSNNTHNNNIHNNNIHNNIHNNMHNTTHNNNTRSNSNNDKNRGGLLARLKEECMIDTSLFNYVPSTNEIINEDIPSFIANFDDLLTSLSILKFSDPEIISIFKVLTSILYLGNLEFKEVNTEPILTNYNIAEKICNLLKIDIDEFMRILTRPVIQAGKDIVRDTRTVPQIIGIVDGLSRILYEKMFDYIIDKMNDVLSYKNTNFDSGADEMRQDVSFIDDTDVNYIGVLDIAGFEIFPHNDFEQLCINLTNEKLQQFFNHHMFILEQEVYKKENIEWTYVDFGMDLQPAIDIIERSNPIGVLAYLDEECVMPGGSDKTFLEKLSKLLKYNRDNTKDGNNAKYGNRYNDGNNAKDGNSIKYGNRYNDNNVNNVKDGNRYNDNNVNNDGNSIKDGNNAKDGNSIKDGNRYNDNNVNNVKDGNRYNDNNVNNDGNSIKDGNRYNVRDGINDGNVNSIKDGNRYNNVKDGNRYNIGDGIKDGNRDNNSIECRDNRDSRNDKLFEVSRLENGFTINHYAGKVTYIVKDWLRKNKDPYFQNIITLLSTSHDRHIKSIINENTNKHTGKKGFFRSVSQKHKEGLGNLLSILKKTNPHFVRCIVPNTLKMSNKFDSNLVIGQMRCNGVLEGIRISRLGYPNRMRFKEFRKRYSILLDRHDIQRVNGLGDGYADDKKDGFVDNKQACIDILNHIGMGTEKSIFNEYKSLNTNTYDNNTNNKSLNNNTHDSLSTNTYDNINTYDSLNTNNTNINNNTYDSLNTNNINSNTYDNINNNSNNNTYDNINTYNSLNTNNINSNTYDNINNNTYDNTNSNKNYEDGKNTSSDTWKIGNTMLFFKNGILAHIEEKREKKVHQLSTQIQHKIRKKIKTLTEKINQKRETTIYTIQKNARLSIQMKMWGWWRIIQKIKPLLQITKHDEEIKQKEVLIGGLRESIRIGESKIVARDAKIEQILGENEYLQRVNNEKDELLQGMRNENEEIGNLKGKCESECVILKDMLVKQEEKEGLLVKEFNEKRAEWEIMVNDKIKCVGDKEKEIVKNRKNIRDLEEVIAKKECEMNDILNSYENEKMEFRDGKVKELEIKCKKFVEDNNEYKEKNKYLEEENKKLVEEYNIIKDERENVVGKNKFLEEENKTLVRDNNELKEKNKFLEEENKTLVKDNNELKDINKHLEEENKTLVRDNNELKDINKHLEEENKTLVRDNNELKEKIKFLEEEHKELKDNNIYLEEENKKLSKKVNESNLAIIENKKMKNNEIEDLNKIINKHINTISENNIQIEKLKDEIINKESKIKNHVQNNKKHKNIIAENNIKIESLENEIDLMKNDNAGLINKYINENKRKDKVIENKESQIINLKDMLASKDNQIENINNECSEKEMRLDIESKKKDSKIIKLRSIIKELLNIKNEIDNTREIIDDRIRQYNKIFFETVQYYRNEIDDVNKKNDERIMEIQLANQSLKQENKREKCLVNKYIQDLKMKDDEIIDLKNIKSMAEREMKEIVCRNMNVKKDLHSIQKKYDSCLKVENENKEMKSKIGLLECRITDLQKIWKKVDLVCLKMMNDREFFFNNILNYDHHEIECDDEESTTSKGRDYCNIKGISKAISNDKEENNNHIEGISKSSGNIEGSINDKEENNNHIEGIINEEEGISKAVGINEEEGISKDISNIEGISEGITKTVGISEGNSDIEGIDIINNETFNDNIKNFIDLENIKNQDEIKIALNFERQKNHILSTRLNKISQMYIKYSASIKKLSENESKSNINKTNLISQNDTLAKIIEIKDFEINILKNDLEMHKYKYQAGNNNNVLYQENKDTDIKDGDNTTKIKNDEKEISENRSNDMIRYRNKCLETDLQILKKKNVCLNNMYKNVQEKLCKMENEKERFKNEYLICKNKNEIDERKINKMERELDEDRNILKALTINPIFGNLDNEI